MTTAQAMSWNGWGGHDQPFTRLLLLDSVVRSWQLSSSIPISLCQPTHQQSECQTQYVVRQSVWQCQKLRSLHSQTLMLSSYLLQQTKNVLGLCWLLRLTMIIFSWPWCVPLLNLVSRVFHIKFCLLWWTLQRDWGAQKLNTSILTTNCPVSWLYRTTTKISD